MKIEYKFSNSKTLCKFTNSNKFIRGIMGPIGSGKSTACVMEIIKKSMLQKPCKQGIRRTRWAVIRNTYSQLKDTTIKTFHQWLPPELFGTWYNSTNRYIISDNKSYHIEILFRALDREDQLNNLLSLELTGAWVNEARDIPWVIIQVLQGRVGRFPAKNNPGASWFGIIMDTNPPDNDSWWYKLFEEDKPKNSQIFKQPSGLSKKAENIENLPKDYYKNLILSMGAEERKIYIEGQYGSIFSGKPVYPEYSDKDNCKKFDIIANLPIYRGWDFGLTPACVFCQFLPTGQLLILDEVIADNIAIEKFGTTILQYSDDNFSGFEFIDIGDPAGESRAQTDEKTCFEIMWAKNINISAGDQDPNIRIEAVRRALNNKPTLLLHPKCNKLRKGFMGGYKYKKLTNKSDIYVSRPDKNSFSHIHDALQYVATILFTDKIKYPNNNGIINLKQSHNPWYI